MGAAMGVQLEHFQARWNHLTDQKMQKTKLLYGMPEREGEPEAV
ncbi:hypothetical protein [Sphingobium sp.]